MLAKSEDKITKFWKDKNPLVTIRCITYNHEKYISQALDGFLMQKTNFPFEVLVHDDASTDNTASIIREYEKKYPNIIKPIYQRENQYSKHDGTISRILNALTKGKYIALCEGDDYWIDENKLQMQVDFLENNPEYGMCYTYSKIYFEEKKILSYKKNGRKFISYEDLLINGNKIPTLTTLFNKKLMNKYHKEIQPSNKGWLMGDYPMWLYFSKNSKIKFFPKVTGVYRILKESASHSQNIKKNIKFRNSVLLIKYFFSNFYNDKKIYDYCLLLEEYKKAYNKSDITLVRKLYRCLPKIAKTKKNKLIFFLSYNIFLFNHLRVKF